MNTFSEEQIRQRLDKLTASQESIQSTSFFFRLHKQHCKEAVRIWTENLSKVSANQKLCFLYLANDVLQNSRKSTQEFVSEFAAVFPGVFKNSFTFVSEDLRNKVVRVLEIWKERNLFPADFIASLLSTSAASATILPGKSIPNIDNSSYQPPIPESARPVVAQINDLSQIQEQKLPRVTKINGIRSQLYLPTEFKRMHHIDQLKSAQKELGAAIKEVQTFLSILDAESNVQHKLVQTLEKIAADHKSAIQELNITKESMNQKLETLSQCSELVKLKLEPPKATEIIGDGAVHPATLDRLTQAAIEPVEF